MRLLKLALLIVAATAVLCNFAFAEPQLSIPDATFDFGYAPQNSTISHIFWLHSTGTDSLRILKVSPG